MPDAKLDTAPPSAVATSLAGTLGEMLAGMLDRLEVSLAEISVEVSLTVRRKDGPALKFTLGARQDDEDRG